MATSQNTQEGVSITFDDKKVRELLARAPQQTEETVHRLLEKAGIEVMGEMRKDAPVGVTGDLRRTTHYYFSKTAEVTVEPTAAYAEDVEKGTRPHFVSVKPGTPLFRWATQKGIPPYAVQQSIAKKGTKAHPFIQPVYDIMEPRVKREFDDGIMELARQLNG